MGEATAGQKNQVLLPRRGARLWGSGGCHARVPLPTVWATTLAAQRQAENRIKGAELGPVSLEDAVVEVRDGRCAQRDH
jgi:hypothetical protein